MDPMTETEKERIKKIMDAHGVDEQEARFIIAMADGEIEGDVLDGVPQDDKPTLGDVVRGERGE
jgi:hypothetical protein